MRSREDEAIANIKNKILHDLYKELMKNTPDIKIIFFEKFKKLAGFFPAERSVNSTLWYLDFAIKNNFNIPIEFKEIALETIDYLFNKTNKDNEGKQNA